MNEILPEEEFALRIQYRPVPNVIGFSLFSRASEKGNRLSYFSVVESSLTKTSAYRWVEWFRDLQDRRDVGSYLKYRWMLN